MTDLPTRQDEAWRWAELGPARRNAGHAPPANDALPDVGARWLDVAGVRHLFVGGQPVDGPAMPPQPDTRAPRHPLADLAAASAPAGFTLEVAAGTDAGTVQLLHVGTGGAAHGVTRVRLAPGARLTLIETLADDTADHWQNHRFDAEVGEGAELTRVVRLVNRHGLASERGFVTLGRAARLNQLAIVSSEAAARTEIAVHHDGPGAQAAVNGILLGDSAAALDSLTRLEHRVPETASTQVWRLVATGRAQVSVAGGVSVARHAQKTDAGQSLKALVLRRTAAANLKPELEILADDVTCAHGCTVGELDRAALFYLESRGVPPADAAALLTHAFVADALAVLGDGPLADALDAETRGWLEARA